MDSRFNENKAEFGVLVLAVTLKMLADSDSLLDQHVQVLWNLRGEAVRLQYSENFITSDNLHLSNSVGVTQDNTNLRRRRTLPGKLADLFNDLVRSGLEPAWRSPGVWDSRCRDSLSIGVKATHFR